MAQTDYYTKTTRSMLACVKEVGAMPFVLFQYYLTWESARIISPSLTAIATDLGILDKSGNPSKSAVSNLKKVLIDKKWIEEQNGEIIILKFRNSEPNRSEKMNTSTKKRSEKMNKGSEKMNESSEILNGTEIANIGIIKKELNNKKRNNIGKQSLQTHKPKVSKVTRDERSGHVAIQAIRKLTGRYPDKLLWDRIIRRFGDSFDFTNLENCRIEWIERGYNPTATTWLNWYFDGIPERKINNNGKSNNKKGNAEIIDEYAEYFASETFQNLGSNQQNSDYSRLEYD